MVNNNETIDLLTNYDVISYYINIILKLQAQRLNLLDFLT